MKEHNKLAFRLNAILGKLIQGDRLNPQVLAQEFGVSERTVQRDINERLAFLPLQKIAGHYSLEPRNLGRLTLKDLERFACLAVVQNMIPALSNDLLKDLLDSRMDSAWLVKGHQYEDHCGNEPLFNALEQVVLAHQSDGFNTPKHWAAKRKRPNCTNPCSRANCSTTVAFGIWPRPTKSGSKPLLSARSPACWSMARPLNPMPTCCKPCKTKTASGSTPKKVKLSSKWPKKPQATFSAANPSAHKPSKNNSKTAASSLAAKSPIVNKILPAVRFWLPHIRIISPEGLQQNMENELRPYVGAV